MAQHDRSFTAGAVGADRAQTRNKGASRKEMTKQRQPSRDTYAAAPQPTEPFDERLDLTTADFRSQDVGRPHMKPQSKQPLRKSDDRDAAALEPVGNAPDQILGDDIEEGALFSSAETRIDPDHTQGAKTRRMNKDIVSRRN